MYFWDIKVVSLFNFQCLVSLNHDAAGTSDDSGRASERLNGPIANRDRDSSHDRLSDVSIDN